MFPTGSEPREQYIISSIPSLTIQCLVQSWHSNSVERMSQLNNEFDYQNICRQSELLPLGREIARAGPSMPCCGTKSVLISRDSYNGKRSKGGKKLDSKDQLVT